MYQANGQYRRIVLNGVRAVHPSKIRNTKGRISDECVKNKINASRRNRAIRLRGSVTISGDTFKEVKEFVHLGFFQAADNNVS